MLLLKIQAGSITWLFLRDAFCDFLQGTVLVQRTQKDLSSCHGLGRVLRSTWKTLLVDVKASLLLCQQMLGYVQNGARLKLSTVISPDHESSQLTDAATEIFGRRSRGHQLIGDVQSTEKKDCGPWTKWTLLLSNVCWHLADVAGLFSRWRWTAQDCRCLKTAVLLCLVQQWLLPIAHRRTVWCAFWRMALLLCWMLPQGLFSIAANQLLVLLCLVLVSSNELFFFFFS